MHAEPSPLLQRVATWLPFLALIFLLGSSVLLGSPDEPGWWIVAAIVVAWQAGPIGLASVCACASRERAGQILFLLLAIAFLIFAAFVQVDAMQSASSTASVALILYPLFEYATWVAVILAAALLGWRARDGWVMD
jgi:hypothetical protein